MIRKEHSHLGLQATILLLAAAYIAPVPLRWKFAAFLVSFLIMVIARMDVKIFLAACLIHLWYIPFALVAQKSALAEASAAYAFYYLLIGLLGFVVQQRHRELTSSREMLDYIAHYKFWRHVTILVAIAVFIAHIRAPDLSRIANLWFLLTVCTAFTWYQQVQLRRAHHHRDADGSKR
jgi:hypothetical protein